MLPAASAVFLTIEAVGVVVSCAMATRKPPRRLPELSADERHMQLFAKYGDLTGGGLVAPTIAQAGELMMRVATSQSAAAMAASGRDSLTEYVTKREHELQMAQMDERMRQLGEELRRREQAHDELARLVQQLLARGGASPSDDLAHSMGYSRARPLAGQHGYPLAEHPVNAMQPLQPLGGLGSNPGSAGPEVDPSAGLPLVPMLALPSAPQPLGSLHDGGGAYDDGGFFAGGAASEGGDSAERDAMDDELMLAELAELGPLGDEGVLGDEGAAGTHDVEPPERTVGEAGTCQLTEAEGFAQVLTLARTRTRTQI